MTSTGYVRRWPVFWTYLDLDVGSRRSRIAEDTGFIDNCCGKGGRVSRDCLRQANHLIY